jgi:hypothetical protein
LLRGGGKKIKQDFCDITIPNTRLSARGLADDFVCFLALRAPSWLANPARKIAAETKCALRSWRRGRGASSPGRHRSNSVSSGWTKANAPSVQLHKGSRQKPTNCAPRLALRGYGVNRASAEKPASFSLRSTAGLLKGLTGTLDERRFFCPPPTPRREEVAEGVQRVFRFAVVLDHASGAHDPRPVPAAVFSQAVLSDGP